MKEETIVSMWVGVVSTHYDLENYVTSDYSEDGDYAGSQFSREFYIEFVDDDFLEQDFVASSSSLPELLSGFSYAESIVSKLISNKVTLDAEVNAIILIYNYRYSEDTCRRNAPSNFKYVGAFSYR